MYWYCVHWVTITKLAQYLFLGWTGLGTILKEAVCNGFLETGKELTRATG